MPALDTLQDIQTAYADATLAAHDLDYTTFLARYRGQKAEWILGRAYLMSPITGQHNEINAFVYNLLVLYLNKTEGGKVRSDRFSMKLSETYAPEPDVLVVTPPHLERLTETALLGPADIAIEIVSEESKKRDRGFKFDEYEIHGVKEYWIIDPLRNEALFYVLDEAGVYQANHADSDGIYTSAVLPRLRFPVQVLFQYPAPDAEAVVELVRQMLA
jgi:Uma2 family endonuclease